MTLPLRWPHFTDFPWLTSAQIHNPSLVIDHNEKKCNKMLEQLLHLQHTKKITFCFLHWYIDL